MKIEVLAEHLNHYLAAPVIETISTDDQMFSGDRTSYYAIGQSAINAIVPAVTIAQKRNFNRVLDFGCGYGRVGRHLKSFFKDSELHFTDIKPDAVDFCANTFSGKGFVSSTDFNELNFPAKYDLIWVGFVFTHIDFERQKLLFRKLFQALQPGGILVMTYHGRRCLEMKNAGQIAYIEEGRWKRIVSSYETQGCGYERYGREDLGDWGISLNSIESMTGLVEIEKESRVIALVEAGWANHQDVIAFKATEK